MISSTDIDLLRTVTFAVIGSTILLVLRWAALPKPIPGIPYNEVSTKRISGDGPEMKKAARARNVRSWMRDQFASHGSPILQLFIRPFGKPNVLVSDFRESMDILMRRTKEFDRSKRSIEAFSGLVASCHIAMRSSDPRFMQSKELVRDLMSPNFLHDVSAPEIYEKVTNLLDLWALKIQDGNGRPFEAGKDLDIASLDIIMSVAFDVSQGDSTLAKQVAKWHSSSQTTIGGNLEEPIAFPYAELDPEWQACVWLTESISVAFRARMPRLSHWLYLQRSRAKKMKRLKNQLIARNIDSGVRRLQRYRAEQSEVQKIKEIKGRKLRCAVDQILLREMAAAKKAERPPDFHRAAIYDELFVYIIGGHDTISSTLAWWVKYAARYQLSQARLREALYIAYKAAREESRLPTVEEIVRTSIPYLDAFIEETLRYSHIAPAVLRQATVDTQILGHPIPEGTDIFLNTSAASFMQPAFEIDERRRSATARRAHDDRAWDPANVGEFVPERWLKEAKAQEDGATGNREVFDARAGPMMAFGVGRRSCFGRKLVYVELRIVLTLLIWRFQFLDMEQLNDFASVDSLSQRPRECFVKLRVKS